MNVTLNTTRPDYSYRYNNNSEKNYASAQSFGGSMPIQSAFLNPFKKGMDKLTDKIAQYYTAPLFSSKITNWLSKKDNIGSIVDHMQTIGSVVISGMYMTQTLRNQNMDEKRKKTLAVNQGLTLVASTGIAYLFSHWFLGPWNNKISMPYAAKKLNTSVEQLEKDLNTHREKIKKLYIEKHPDDVELKKFKKPNLMHYVDKGLKDADLAGKLKGLDVLKSLIIFGSVYRFLGPVAVTPVANWIGDKLFGNTGKDKQAEAVKAQNQQKAETDNQADLKTKRPELKNFLNGMKA